MTENDGQRCLYGGTSCLQTKPSPPLNYCVSKIPRVLVLKWQLHILLVGQLLKQVHFPQGCLMPWSFTYILVTLDCCRSCVVTGHQQFMTNPYPFSLPLLLPLPEHCRARGTADAVHDQCAQSGGGAVYHSHPLPLSWVLSVQGHCAGLRWQVWGL